MASAPRSEERAKVIVDASGVVIFPSALELARQNCEAVYNSTIRVNETLHFRVKVIPDRKTFRELHGINPPRLPAFFLVSEITRAPRFGTMFTIVGENAEMLTRSHVTCIHSSWYYYTDEDLRRLAYPYLGASSPEVKDEDMVAVHHTTKGNMSQTIYMPPNPDATMITTDEEFAGWTAHPRRRQVRLEPCDSPDTSLDSTISIGGYLSPVGSLVDPMLSAAPVDKFDDVFDMPMSTPETSPEQPTRIIDIPHTYPHIASYGIGNTWHKLPGPHKDEPASGACVVDFFNECVE